MLRFRLRLATGAQTPVDDFCLVDLVAVVVLDIQARLSALCAIGIHQ